MAVVLVALLAAAGTIFGTDLLKGDDPSPPTAAVKKPVAGKKLAVKATAVKPLSGTRTTIRGKINTLGGSYSLTTPTGFEPTVDEVTGRPRGHRDVIMLDGAFHALHIVSMRLHGATADGVLSASQLNQIKGAAADSLEGGQILPSTKTVSVAGVHASRFDVTGDNVRTRVVVFRRNGIIYATTWTSVADDFDSSVATMNRILATWKFDKAT